LAKPISEKDKMGKLYPFAAFLSIILLISFVLNFYVLWRLCDLFKIKRGVIFWIAVLICSTSLIGSSILRSHFDNIISKVFFIVAVNWLGIMWLLFSTLIVYEIVRLFIKINSSTAGVAILIIVGLATICAMINAQLVRVKELVIPGNANLSIVQISDIHLGSTSEKFLQRVIEKTNALEPNLIVITGDIADGYSERTQKVLQRLKDLKADVFFVTGNHEMYAGAEKVSDALGRANVKVLRNQLADCNEIQIIGIDESTDLQDVGWTVERLNRDKSKFCVLLSHRPISPKVLSDMKINLELAGHLHGGQIFPFNYVVGLFGKYMSGLYKENGSYLYVTTGAGTWGPRMRLGSRSEIVLIRIRNEKPPDKSGG
jgi:predicted MPP superfamily phosphohydrolase